jgi:hypothetical protein
MHSLLVDFMTCHMCINKLSCPIYLAGCFGQSFSKHSTPMCGVWNAGRADHNNPVPVGQINVF